MKYVLPWAITASVIAAIALLVPAIVRGSNLSLPELFTGFTLGWCWATVFAVYKFEKFLNRPY